MSIVILPFGATEQHGPHLPAETDTIIASALGRRLLKRNAHLPLRLHATEEVGYSPEHVRWPATRSLGYHEAIERWIGIGARLAEDGHRRVLLLNAHGGNSPLLDIVAMELRRRHDMLAVVTNWHRFIEPGRHVSAEERALGIHAGQIETSVMLALAPDRVDLAAAADFPSRQSTFTEHHDLLRAYGPHHFGWMMQDLNGDGAVGNAAAATEEIGEALIDEALSGLSTLLADMMAFDLDLFGAIPRR